MMVPKSVGRIAAVLGTTGVDETTNLFTSLASPKNLNSDQPFFFFS